MWAIQQTLPRMRQKQRGFTIVELLIVIVVIGILAAITIVAYNGVQSRAHAAAAQADATNLTKLLTNYNTLNGTYPIDLTTVNNGNPMPSTDGTTYAYHPGSGNTSFCATVTNVNASYKITDANPSPATGGCAGDGVNGVAPITNLAVNPSFESGLSGVSSYNVNNANQTVADAFSGGRILRATRNNTTGTTGPWWDVTTVTAGQTYYVSLATRSNVSLSRTLNIEWLDSTKATRISTSAVVSNVTPGASWGTIGGSAVAPAGAVNMRLTFYGTGNGALTDYVDIDAVMVTQGSSSYNFADGNTANWIWTGAANTSTSQGPPQ
jgi:prepilin-type N-terminal cleavage/methylation domain-containing protein